MILSTIKDGGTYSAISPLIKEAIEWLQNWNEADFKPGKLELPGGIVVKFQEPALVPAEKARFEAHKRFIDIQVPLKGVEIMGWAPIDDLKNVIEPYNEDKDVVFLGDSTQNLINVYPGQMAIFFPEDAHAPNIGIGNHRKLCIKIPVIK
ncbi:MAG: YhcH/YjgK/YiaL family protein [Muribaculaceae bacterium]